MLQHNDWLHVILVGREFAFQVVDLLEKINDRGYQFDFSYEENTLKLDQIFQSGRPPNPENLKLLESFRQEYPEKELKVYPPLYLIILLSFGVQSIQAQFKCPDLDCFIDALEDGKEATYLHQDASFFVLLSSPIEQRWTISKDGIFSIVVSGREYMS